MPRANRGLHRCSRRRQHPPQQRCPQPASCKLLRQRRHKKRHTLNTITPVSYALPSLMVKYLAPPTNATALSVWKVVWRERLPARKKVLSAPFLHWKRRHRAHRRKQRRTAVSTTATVPAPAGPAWCVLAEGEGATPAAHADQSFTSLASAILCGLGKFARDTTQVSSVTCAARNTGRRIAARQRRRQAERVTT